MTFLEFCKRLVTDVELCAVEADVPDKYKKPVEAMIQIMKNKKDIFDSIDVPPYIEGAFAENYEDILKEKLVDGEVPDGIIHTLSVEIFGNYPSRLSKDQQAIIKILSTYICIQS